MSEAQLKAETAAASARKLRNPHWHDCPSLRGDECMCPDTLNHLTEAQLKKAGEHPDRMALVDKGDPKAKLPNLRQPRWVCIGCGWAGRGTDVTHTCDTSVLARMKRVPSLSEYLSAEDLFSGRYFLGFFRDSMDEYTIFEQYFDPVTKKTERNVLQEKIGFHELSGAIENHTVDCFSP